VAFIFIHHGFSGAYRRLPDTGCESQKPFRADGVHFTSLRKKSLTLGYEKAYGQHFDDMDRRVPSLEKIKRVIEVIENAKQNKTLDGLSNS
jgi:hypothetical protein